MSYKTNKIWKIFLPVLTGLIISILYLQAVQSLFIYIRHIDLTEDGVYIFQLLFDFYFYLPVYIITLFIAIIFQYFIAHPILDICRKKQAVYTLKFWQLALLSCILFGVSLGFIFRNTWDSIGDLFVKILIGVMLAAVYWTGNLLTVFIIAKRK